MKDRIQKLCKRLSRFTLEEIELIAELEEAEIKPILKELIEENFLNKQNSIYFYTEEKKSQKNRLPIMFQFHSSEDVDMLIKHFCAGVPTDKGAFLLGISDATLQKFNLYFRKLIYEKQLQKLKEYFVRNPKIAKVRNFYGISVYFYLYGDELFVIEKPLNLKDLKPHSKEETLRIKVFYSRLRRSINHSNMKILMSHHIAEHIWKYGRGYEMLKKELTQILS